VGADRRPRRGGRELSPAAAAPAPLAGKPAAARADAAGGLDGAAFGVFYQRTVRALWAYLARVSGDRALADDLAQEAYLRLLRSGFVGEGEEHRRRYLFRVAGNLLTDHRRRRRRELPAPADDLEAAAPAGDRGAGAAAGETGALRRDLGRLMAVLRPRQRQVLWLAHVEGQSHREIAAALGVGEASVRLILFRARRKLAARLRREGYRPEE
jgi:RNA polymerase sigma-70 factor (ECF subfamily)